MAIYLCEWPTGDLSIISAESKVELFEKLDIEGDPMCVGFYELRDGEHLVKPRGLIDGWAFEFDGCDDREKNCDECKEESCEECDGVPFEHFTEEVGKQYKEQCEKKVAATWKAILDESEEG